MNHSTNPIHQDLSNEFAFFHNESPFQLPQIPFPFAPNEPSEKHPYKPQSIFTEPSNINTLNKDTSISGDSNDTISISDNSCYNHSRFMPFIEPWRCNQIGSNHDDNSSIFNDYSLLSSLKIYFLKLTIFCQYNM